MKVTDTFKCLLQHHSSKASILRCSAFSMVHLSHPYMTTRRTIALTRQAFVGKVMSLLFNMLCRLVIAFLPRSKHLLISWLQSPFAVILEPKKIKTVTVSIVLRLIFTIYPWIIPMTDFSRGGKWLLRCGNAAERQGRIQPGSKLRGCKVAHGHAHPTASHVPLSARPDFVELSP